MITANDLPLELQVQLEKYFLPNFSTPVPFDARKIEHPSEYYLSEEYLEKSSLVDSAKTSKLIRHINNLGISEIEGSEEFLKSKGFKSAEEKPSGCFFYPEDGFMSWHTNYKRDDWRIYFVKSPKADGFFRYKLDGKIVTDYDLFGWSYRIFHVGDKDNPFWHCVYGGSGRYSIGFRLEKLPETT